MPKKLFIILLTFCCLNGWAQVENDFTEPQRASGAEALEMLSDVLHPKIAYPINDELWIVDVDLDTNNMMLVNTIDWDTEFNKFEYLTSTNTLNDIIRNGILGSYDELTYACASLLGVGQRFFIRLKGTSYSASVEISAEDVLRYMPGYDESQEDLNEDVSEGIAFVRQSVEESNKVLPIQFSEDFAFVKLQLEDSVLYFIYEISDIRQINQSYGISMMKEDQWLKSVAPYLKKVVAKFIEKKSRKEMVCEIDAKDIVSNKEHRNIKLENIAQKTNAMCPMQINEYIEMRSFEYLNDERLLRLTYSVDDVFIDQMEGRDEEVHDLLVTNLTYDYSSKELLEDLADDKGRILAIWIGRKSLRRIQVELSAEEIKRLASQ